MIKLGPATACKRLFSAAPETKVVRVGSKPLAKFQPHGKEAVAIKRKLGLEKRVLCEYTLFDTQVKSLKGSPPIYFGFWSLDDLKGATEADNYGLIGYRQEDGKESLRPTIGSNAVSSDKFGFAKHPDEAALAIHAFPNLHVRKSFSQKGVVGELQRGGPLSLSENACRGVYLRPSSELRNSLMDFCKKVSMQLSGKHIPSYITHQLGLQFGKHTFAPTEFASNGAWGSVPSQLPSLMSYGELRKVPLNGSGGLSTIFHTGVAANLVKLPGESVSETFFMDLLLKPQNVCNPGESEVLSLRWLLEPADQLPLVKLDSISTAGLRECKLSLVSPDPQRFDLRLSFNSRSNFGETTALYHQLTRKLRSLNTATSVSECIDVCYSAFHGSDSAWAVESCLWYNKKVNRLEVDGESLLLSATYPLSLRETTSTDPRELFSPSKSNLLVRKSLTSESLCSLLSGASQRDPEELPKALFSSLTRLFKRSEDHRASEYPLYNLRAPKSF